MIMDFDGWKMWWMSRRRWVGVGMKGEGGFELVSKYQVTIVPVMSSLLSFQ